MTVATGSGLKRLNVHTRASFVKPAVIEKPLTTKIINEIMPFYPRGCIVIGGYLDDAAQFWKVNYHYDLLMCMLDKLQALPKMDAKFKGFAKAIQATLLVNQPNPKTGYKDDATVGLTKDSSTTDQIRKRYALVKQAKRDFRTVIIKAGVVDAKQEKNPPTDQKRWWLSVAPLAAPGTSMHGTGYALDISGNNNETTRISDALGATLSFNEASHVHVEFAKGVKLPA
jgi:hypothetical protein